MMNGFAGLNPVIMNIPEACIDESYATGGSWYFADLPTHPFGFACRQGARIDYFELLRIIRTILYLIGCGYIVICIKHLLTSSYDVTISGVGPPFDRGQAGHYCPAFSF